MFLGNRQFRVCEGILSRIAVVCFFSKTFDLKNVQFEFHKLYVIIALR